VDRWIKEAIHIRKEQDKSMNRDQGLINVISFQARMEGVRPEGPRCEARRAESGGGVLEEASPLPTS